MVLHELLSAKQAIELLRKEWGWIALRGVTLTILVIVWGAYALMDGVLALVAGLRMRDNGKPLWSLIIIGLLGIGAGIATFFWPGLTALTLVFIIGSWAIVMGLFQIIAAVRLRKYIQSEWLHALSGLLSIVFGVAVVLRPGTGAVAFAFAFAWIVGWFAIVFGVMLISMALRLRSGRRA